MVPKKILITGAHGVIGGILYRKLSEQPDLYDLYGTDINGKPSERLPPPWRPEIPPSKFLVGNLADINVARNAIQGMHTLIHMAADPKPRAPWESTLNSNVISTYNVFEACREVGVQQVIFASSIRTVLGYSGQEPYKAIMENRLADIPPSFPFITHTMPPWPVEAYSASKIWGEALARSYNYKHNLRCICLRLGGIPADGTPHHNHQGGLSVWCSFRDVVQLVQRCLDAADRVSFDIFFALSNNRYRWMDIEHARDVLGYVPEDNADESIVPLPEKK